MDPSKNIVQNIMNSRAHTTLVYAGELAGMGYTLAKPGPFTLFAATNTAFDKLPSGMLDNLLKPENKTTLFGIMTYCIVPGRITTEMLKQMIEKGSGKAELKTLQGEMLTARLKDEHIILSDQKGGTATVTIPDVKQSNGIIHVISDVLMPN